MTAGAPTRLAIIDPFQSWKGHMGKGDKRSFKGKVFKGSFGKTRRRKKPKAAAGATSHAAQQKRKA